MLEDSHLSDRKLLQNIIDALPVLLYWCNTDHIVVGNNLQHAAAFGFSSSDQVVGLSVEQCMNHVGLDRVVIEQACKDDKAIMRSGKGKILEYTGVMADGVEHTYLSHKQPLADERGNIIGMVGISVDITELKQTQAQLVAVNEEAKANFRRASKIYQNIIDALPVLLFWTDKDDNYAGNNLPHAKAFGFETAEELIGKSVGVSLKNIHMDADLIDRIHREHVEILQSKVGKILEYTTVLADRKEKTWLSYKQPLFNEDDEVIGLTGISVDITELKNTQRSLEEAKAAAELANKAKSDFLANMSHDIRTPLTGIIGMAEAIATSHLNPDQLQEYSQQLVGAGHRLLDLLNEILELTRLEHSDFLGSKKVFDLKVLLESVVELLRPSLNDKGLKFDFYFDERIPSLLAGYNILLHRVLLNLLGNAIKFTSVGGVVLRVDLLEEGGHQVLLRLSVEDSGLGISSQKLSHIFEPFSRIGSPYESAYQGVGLGLHIVKQFVEKMDGEITVESKEGEGSQFICTIPFDLASIQEGQQFLDKQQIQALATQTLPAKEKPIGKVLLVEDDQLAARVASMTLVKLHESVDFAANGKEALARMKENFYDLVYLDVGLPEISGDKVARLFRAWEKEHRSYQTPLIALTAHVDESYKQRCLDSGMDFVLTKPLNQQMASRVLHTYITDKQKNVVVNLEPTTVATDVIDLQLGAELTGSKEAAQEILAMLANEMPSVRTNLRDAYVGSDWQRLLKVAHKLHGATCYTGTPQLKAAASALEMDLKRGRGDVTAHYERLLQAIDSFLQAYHLLSD